MENRNFTTFYDGSDLHVSSCRRCTQQSTPQVNICESKRNLWNVWDLKIHLEVWFDAYFPSLKTTIACWHWLGNPKSPNEKSLAFSLSIIIYYLNCFFEAGSDRNSWRIFFFPPPWAHDDWLNIQFNLNPLKCFQAHSNARLRVKNLFSWSRFRRHFVDLIVSLKLEIPTTFGHCSRNQTFVQAKHIKKSHSRRTFCYHISHQFSNYLRTP